MSNPKASRKSKVIVSSTCDPGLKPKSTGGDAGETGADPDFGGTGDLDTIIQGISLLQPTTKYRASTLGKTLVEALDQFKGMNKITDTIYEKCLRQFDRSIMNVMTQQLTTRLTFKATKLLTYKYFDGEWAFVLSEAEFRQHGFLANVPALKILAFEGRNPGGLKGGSRRRWRKVDKKNQKS